MFSFEYISTVIVKIIMKEFCDCKHFHRSFEGKFINFYFIFSPPSYNIEKSKFS